MLSLFRIKNKTSGSIHSLMIFDLMKKELRSSPLMSDETLEMSRDGGSTWKNIGLRMPDRIPVKKRHVKSIV